MVLKYKIILLIAVSWPETKWNSFLLSNNPHVRACWCAIIFIHSVDKNNIRLCWLNESTQYFVDDTNILVAVEQCENGNQNICPAIETGRINWNALNLKINWKQLSICWSCPRRSAITTESVESKKCWKWNCRCEHGSDFIWRYVKASKPSIMIWEPAMDGMYQSSHLRVNRVEWTYLAVAFQIASNDTICTHIESFLCSNDHQ